MRRSGGLMREFSVLGQRPSCCMMHVSDVVLKGLTGRWLMHDPRLDKGGIQGP